MQFLGFTQDVATKLVLTSIYFTFSERRREADHRVRHGRDFD
jgi:hypothetical protein